MNRDSYSTTNSRHSREKFVLILVLNLILLVGISFLNIPHNIFLYIIPNTILLIVLVFLYRRSYFELTFEPDKIVLNYQYRTTNRIEFSYNNLEEVHYMTPFNAPGANIFVLISDSHSIKLRVDLIESDDSYIDFIKFLKSKNPKFKTFALPKGSAMHAKLRRELLGEEF